jgi:hypothetical protein
MLIAVITRFAVPVLVTVTVLELLLPTVAVPKDNEFGEMVAETVGPEPGSCWFVDTPVLPHPVITGNANRTTMAQACAAFIAIEFAGFVTVLSSPELPNTSSQMQHCPAPTVSGGDCGFNLNGPLKRYERRPRILYFWQQPYEVAEQGISADAQRMYQE